ncbi:MAG TPA: cell division protein ZapE [Xanthobacteraceae bacterium]|nr:cell division protein ZapE [Xanthobacteraceae bacterium]
MLSTTTVSSQYEALVATGQIEPDPAQRDLARRLTALAERLSDRPLGRKSSALGWLFGARERKQEPLKGLYIYGEVGRGKTMMMDLFFDHCGVSRKRRAHFHEFMADVHERVRAFREEAKIHASGNGRNGEDPLRRTAAAIAGEAALLCFDEFHVTDIADAMILGRLFTRLFELGVVVVATSNVVPDELYKDGLNRALFLPFIPLITAHMDVVKLVSRTDYRMEKLAGASAWIVPADAAADAALDAAWQRLTGGRPGGPVELALKGRAVHVPLAAAGVARFSFDDLCVQPLGAIDYLRIAHEFHTILIDRVPVMDFDRRNHAKRFIILIDTLYEHAVKLIASAEAMPEALYRASTGYEALEFARTASRLNEMGSDDYLALPHGRRSSDATGTSEGLVET